MISLGRSIWQHTSTLTYFCKKELTGYGSNNNKIKFKNSIIITFVHTNCSMRL